MRILIRDTNSKKWKITEDIKAKAEAEFQNLLIESPSLIAIDEIRENASPLVFAMSEFGLPGSGATDVLAFSAEGDIAIIECKLATNPEIKRKVIGQILEYASYLWGMSYEELDNKIRDLKEKPLAELIAESASGEWDEELFRENVRDNLSKGSFILIIVVDEINDELRRIIRYLNECSKSAFSIHALELKRFQHEKIEILVPHLYGASLKPTREERGKWTEEKFFKVFEENNESQIVEKIRELYEWSKKTADRISFGTGKDTGSFTFHYLKDNKVISVFTVTTNGKFSINYGWMINKLPDEAIKEFHNMVKEIPALREIPAEGWPSINVSALLKDDGLNKLKTAVHSLGIKIKKSS
ncbi:MAG: hypothetical protein QXZ28_03455 [Candidatus Methanomethylicaceae archaeon]